MADSVNNPVYYTNVSIECIEAMRISFGPTATFNFCICNAFKYLWRFDGKGKEEDIRKALKYCDFAEEITGGVTWQVSEIRQVANKKLNELYADLENIDI